MSASVQQRIASLERRCWWLAVGLVLVGAALAAAVMQCVRWHL